MSFPNFSSWPGFINVHNKSDFTLVNASDCMQIKISYKGAHCCIDKREQTGHYQSIEMY